MSHPLLSSVSLSVLRERVAAFRRLDLSSASIDQVQKRLDRVLFGYSIQPQAIQFPFVWRARQNEPGQRFERVEELWYPPATVTRMGRLNEPGQPVFYASGGAALAMSEIRAKAGDIITLLKVRTKGELVPLSEIRAREDGTRRNVRLPIMPDGIPPYLDLVPKIVFSAIGIERLRVTSLSNPEKLAWSARYQATMGSLSTQRKWMLIDDFLAEHLTRDVAPGSEYLYKPTIALAREMFGIPYLHGILYPSVASGLRGENVCFSTRLADLLLEPAHLFIYQLQNEPVDRDFTVRLLSMGLPQRDGSIQWSNGGAAESVSGDLLNLL